MHYFILWSTQSILYSPGAQSHAILPVLYSGNVFENARTAHCDVTVWWRLMSPGSGLCRQRATDCDLASLAASLTWYHHADSSVCCFPTDKKKKKKEKFQACFMFGFKFTVYNSRHIQALPPSPKEWAFPEGWANPTIPVIVGHAYQSQMNAENLKFEPVFLLSCFPATHCRMGFSSPEC